MYLCTYKADTKLCTIHTHTKAFRFSISGFIKEHTDFMRRKIINLSVNSLQSECTFVVIGLRFLKECRLWKVPSLLSFAHLVAEARR
jgi:hypothetical protein